MAASRSARCRLDRNGRGWRCSIRAAKRGGRRATGAPEAQRLAGLPAAAGATKWGRLGLCEARTRKGAPWPAASRAAPGPCAAAQLPCSCCRHRLGPQERSCLCSERLIPRIGLGAQACGRLGPTGRGSARGKGVRPEAVSVILGAGPPLGIGEGCHAGGSGSPRAGPGWAALRCSHPRRRSPPSRVAPNATSRSQSAPFTCGAFAFQSTPHERRGVALAATETRPGVTATISPSSRPRTSSVDYKPARRGVSLRETPARPVARPSEAAGHRLGDLRGPQWPCLTLKRFELRVWPPKRASYRRRTSMW
jgi:hypothetical protein